MCIQAIDRRLLKAKTYTNRPRVPALKRCPKWKVGKLWKSSRWPTERLFGAFPCFRPLIDSEINLFFCRSIVNGLRADDAESLYQNRVSMSSEFSGLGGAHDDEGEQLFFKEHTRSPSKASNNSNSNLARRKTLAAQQSASANRPETKVQSPNKHNLDDENVRN